jgi:hypothetical protein
VQGSLHFGSIIAITETVLLAETWRRTLRKKRSWPGWREKASLWGLVCASLAVVLLLCLVLVLHFNENSNFAAMFFVVENVAGIPLGLAGIVLGILGSGSPKTASLIWSIVALVSIIIVSIATLARENVCFHQQGGSGVRSFRVQMKFALASQVPKVNKP